MAVMAVSLQARPAYPGMVKLTQPDGSTIMVRIHGDEWGHWMTDASGKVIEMGEDGVKPWALRPKLPQPLPVSAVRQ